MTCRNRCVYIVLHVFLLPDVGGGATVCYLQIPTIQGKDSKHSIITHTHSHTLLKLKSYPVSMLNYMMPGSVKVETSLIPGACFTRQGQTPPLKSIQGGVRYFVSINYWFIDVFVFVFVQNLRSKISSIG